VVTKLFGLRPGDVRLRTFHAHKGTDDVRVVGRLTGQDSSPPETLPNFETQTVQSLVDRGFEGYKLTDKTIRS
jgi:hypothetical protein